MEPQKIADELISVGQILYKTSVRLRALRPHLRGPALPLILDQIRNAADNAIDLGSEIRAGVVSVPAEDPRPLLDRIESVAVEDPPEPKRFAITEQVPPWPPVPIEPEPDPPRNGLVELAAEPAEPAPDRQTRKREADRKYAAKRKAARDLAKALGNPVESTGAAVGTIARESVIGTTEPAKSLAAEPTAEIFSRWWEVYDRRESPPVRLGQVQGVNSTRAVMAAEEDFPDVPKRMLEIREVVRSNGRRKRSEVGT